jgi:hypothetical protein
LKGEERQWSSTFFCFGGRWKPGLKGKIAGIIDLSCGANFSARAKGYTHGLVMRFTDRAALEAYYPHPDHQRVVQNLINPIRADTLVLDYEF